MVFNLAHAAVWVVSTSSTASTIPGKGPESLENGSVACTAAKVSCRPRGKLQCHCSPQVARSLWLCCTCLTFDILCLLPKRSLSWLYFCPQKECPDQAQYRPSQGLITSVSFSNYITSMLHLQSGSSCKKGLPSFIPCPLYFRYCITSDSKEV